MIGALTAGRVSIQAREPTAGFRSHLAVDLGGDEGPLPPAAAGGEPVADDRFSFARLAAIAVGGVEAAPTGKVSASPDGSHTPLILLASQRTPSGCRES
jgi:hypothetical protein